MFDLQFPIAPVAVGAVLLLSLLYVMLVAVIDWRVRKAMRGYILTRTILPPRNARGQFTRRD